MRIRMMTPLTAAMLAISATGYAQSITLPPSGDNQRSQVSQQIGLVQVSIDYGSPDVHAPNGDDRRGKIWGTLVPYGIHDLQFNDRKGPWRAGANENTVFTVSHPVKVQGQPLPAPNAANKTLMMNIRKLKLDVERHAAVHSPRVGTHEEFMRIFAGGTRTN